MSPALWYQDPARLKVLRQRLKTLQKSAKKLLAKYPDQAQLLEFQKKTYGYWTDRRGFLPGNGQGHPLEFTLLSLLLSAFSSQGLSWQNVPEFCNLALSQLSDPHDLSTECAILGKKRSHRGVLELLRNLAALVYSDQYWIPEPE